MDGASRLVCEGSWYQRRVTQYRWEMVAQVSEGRLCVDAAPMCGVICGGTTEGSQAQADRLSTRIHVSGNNEYGLGEGPSESG